MVKPENYNVLYTNTELQGWEMSLGRRMNDYHKLNPLPSTAVCVLDGGYQLFTKASQYAAFDLKLDFCKVSSYEGTEKVGKPRLQRFRDENGFDLPIDSNNRIYVFDDIIDSGETAKVIAEYYEANFRPAELILCTVVDKAHAPLVELQKYYSQIWSGFHINNEWLVGYGMDNPEGFMRQSPSILKLNKND